MTGEDKSERQDVTERAGERDWRLPWEPSQSAGEAGTERGGLVSPAPQDLWAWLQMPSVPLILSSASCSCSYPQSAEVCNP